jgi:hypothetical protein
VCSQRSTSETSIDKQRFSRHVSAATDGHENNRESVGDGDLYSVRPGVIKGGHEIDSAVSGSVGRHFRRQFSS